MPKTRSGRILFALIVCAALFVIGRNLYHRYLNNALIDAIKAKNDMAVRRLLALGADANATTMRPDTTNALSALDLAMSTDELDARGDTACMLIQHGANIRQSPSSYPVYLATACREGNVEVVRCLLDHGADPNSVSRYHDTPLDFAIRYRLGSSAYTGPGASPPPAIAMKQRRLDVSREMVTLLRQHGARLTLLQAVQLEDVGGAQAALEAGANVNEQDQGSQTALYGAAEAGDMPLMQVLLAHGADVNSGSYGTPLEIAAEKGYLDAVKLLLAQGANVNLAGKYSGLPLTASIYGKHIKVARLLLAHGADVNSKPNEYGLTALAAAVRDLPEFVPELLARGADINGAGGAALREAIRAHNPDMARYLLQRGAKIYPPISKVVLLPPPSQSGPSGKPEPALITTPSTLRVAVTSGPECFELLMQAGADITPDKPDILLAAASAGHAKLFDRLIALGANVNAQDTQGRTPLTEALNHAPAGVQTLLEHGANPNVVLQPLPSQPWQTPLIMAVQTGNADTIRLLLAHGADVNARPPHSHTALYFARRHKNGSADVVRLLEQKNAKEEQTHP